MKIGAWRMEEIKRIVFYHLGRPDWRLFAHRVGT